MNIVEAIADENLYAPWFPGPTWNPWRVVLKGIFAVQMTSEEKAFFRSVADRDPPSEPVSEVWIIAGRRAGKDSIASVLAAHLAAMFSDGDRLRPGEQGPRGFMMQFAPNWNASKPIRRTTKPRPRTPGRLI